MLYDSVKIYLLYQTRFIKIHQFSKRKKNYMNSRIAFRLNHSVFLVLKCVYISVYFCLRIIKVKTCTYELLSVMNCYLDFYILENTIFHTDCNLYIFKINANSMYHHVISLDEYFFFTKRYK